MEIAEGAPKHDVEDQDMYHAISNAVVIGMTAPDATFRYMGPALSGSDVYPGK